MTKLEMAIEITNQLLYPTYKGPKTLSPDHWKVQDLMKMKWDDLRYFYRMALRAKEATTKEKT